MGLYQGRGGGAYKRQFTVFASKMSLFRSVTSMSGGNKSYVEKAQLRKT